MSRVSPLCLKQSASLQHTGSRSCRNGKVGREGELHCPFPHPKTKEEEKSTMERYKTQLALKPCITFLLCSMQKPISIVMTLGYKNSTLWLSMLYPCQ